MSQNSDVVGREPNSKSDLKLIKQPREMFPSTPISVPHSKKPAINLLKIIRWKLPSVDYYTKYLAGLAAEEIMKSEGHLCNNCLIISRHKLSLLWSRREPRESWHVSVESLSGVTPTSCREWLPVCTLITRRYFARDMVFSWFHKGVENALACCGSASKAEIISAASDSIETVQQISSRGYH